jgi:Tn3 transposase DDE domain
MIGGAVNLRLIGENWDETLRLAASIKAGTVAPSILMRRLAAYPKQNARSKTLREIGCLERSLFTLDWISDPALRRRTTASLNKCEARNALARAVFFRRLGEIRDRTFENQKYRASGLNLVVASVVLWNTVYLDRAVTELRSRGEVVRDDLLAHIAHIARSAGSTSHSMATMFGQPNHFKMASGRFDLNAQQSLMRLSVGYWEDSVMTPCQSGLVSRSLLVACTLCI